MIRVISFILILILNASSWSCAQELSITKGHQYLQSKDYDAAVEVYDSLLSKGKESVALYYNLGIAYYEKGNYPHAILNFEKAKKLDPNNKDVNHNLSLANQKLEQEFIKVKPFFLVKWWESLVKTFALNYWVFITFLLIFGAIVSLYFYLFGRTEPLKKWGMRAFYPLLFLFLFSLLASFSRYRLLSDDSYAILVEEVPLFEGADTRSEALYTLNRGTKIKILDTLEGWIKVELINKETGWMENSGFERI